MRPPATLDAAALAREADRFRPKLAAAKSRIILPVGAWYEYDSLSNFVVLADCLQKTAHRQFLALAGTGRILDVGCADGDTAFFLESLGYAVDVVDHPATNSNWMHGVRELKEHFGSSIGVHAADLDAHFTLPGSGYGLAFFLGLLYHLKNPYNALETLAHHCHHCILSTRVARFAPDRQTLLEPLPVAYLLNEAEANNDPTNYWIFSDTGLRRLLDRCGWDVLAYRNTGAAQSDPISQRGDARAFCLLRSRTVLPVGEVELGHGWHPLEYGRWRWTERRFSVTLRTGSPPQPGAALQFRFHLPATLAGCLGAIRLQATVDGVPLEPRTYAEPGEHVYTALLTEAVGSREVGIEFELDRALPPGDQDRRELGLQVACSTPLHQSSDVPILLT